MNGFVDDVVAEVISLTVRDASLYPATGHPHAVVARMMIASVTFLRKCSLRVDGASKLASPDDQRFVKHAPLLEILHQRRRGLIGVKAL